MQFIKLAFLLLLVCLVFYVQQASASVVISEVLWMGSDKSTADEWVELAGIEGDTVISGWTLKTLSSSEEIEIIRFADGTTIADGEYLVVSNFNAENSCLLDEPYAVTTSVSLPNSKLLIRLYDASGTLIDQADDGIGEPFAGINASGTGTRASMERIDLAISGDQQENWRSAQVLFGFDEGAPMLGTPGHVNGEGNLPNSDEEENEDSPEESAEEESSSSDASYSSETTDDQDAAEDETEDGVVEDETEEESSSVSSLYTEDKKVPHPNVFITEILANPAGSDTEEWVEIANFGTGSVNIAGWILRLEGATKGYTIPESQTGSGFLLVPRQHIVFRKTESGVSLRNAGDTVVLTNGEEVIHSLFYPEAADNVSYGLDPYDTNHHMHFCMSTLSAQNQISSIEVYIGIQSHTGDSMKKGVISGVDKVSVNLEAKSPNSLKGIECIWNFGDGETSESCNPGAHVYSLRGVYGVTMKAQDKCGTTVEQRLSVFVEEAKEEKDTKEPKESGDSSLLTSASFSSFPSLSSAYSCTPSAFSGIQISEFLPNPQGDDTSGEWIELINQTNKDAELCGWSIDDSEEGSNPFSLDDLIIKSNDFLILPRTKTKIALNNKDDAVRLFAPVASGASVLFADISYGKVKEGESYARSSSGSYLWTTEKTPGFANVFTEVPVKKSTVSKSNAGFAVANILEKKTYTKSSVKQAKPSTWVKTKYKNVMPWMSQEVVESEIPESHRYLAQFTQPMQNTVLENSTKKESNGREFTVVLLANIAGAIFLGAKRYLL